MFFDNFIYFCNKKGISPSAAGEEMGFHRSQISRWANSETLPRRANLMRIADYFGCTVEDLLADKAAFDVQAFSEKENAPAQIGERDKEILANCKDLSADEMQKVFAYIEGLKANRK